MKRLLLTIFLMSGIWSIAGAATYPVHLNLGQVYDSCIIYRLVDGSVDDSIIKTSFSGIDTTYEIGSDSLLQILFLYKFNGSRWTSYREDYNLLVSKLSVNWPTVAYFTDDVDSIIGKYWENGTLVTTTNLGAIQALDVGAYYQIAKRDTQYKTVFDIYYDGETYPVSFANQLSWDSLSSTSVIPGAPKTCVVWGYLGDVSKNLQTADIELTFTLPEKVNDICDSTILITRSKKCVSGANGYFSIELKWSSCFAGAKYKLSIGTGSVSAITRDVSVPDQSNYRLTW